MKIFIFITLVVIVFGAVAYFGFGVGRPNPEGCPDGHIINRMPGAGGEDYYIKDNARIDLSESELDWVEKNCRVKKMDVY
jgi:hypothetical protein